MSKYFWRGEPVTVRFGLVKVEENKEKPLYWYNYEVAVDNPASKFSFVDAIEITTKDSVFCIANHFGVGVYKLLQGGWPNVSHFSLPGGSMFLEQKGFEEFHSEFNLIGYEKYERLRRRWQAKHFPEEFNKNERLRKLFKK